MITIALIEPEKEENVGRIARVMKNFGCEKLLLINPKCKHLGMKAMALASHAADILKNAEAGGIEKLSTLDYLVGTTAILGRDSNIPRTPLAPREAGSLISRKKLNIGLLFGRESSGLTNEELMMCDMLVTIPTAKKYSTMNLSQAVGILLYEIFVSTGEDHVSSHITFANGKDKEVLLMHINSVLESIDFPTKEKKETQRKAWKRVVGKSMLSKKEATALMGFFKKVMWKFENGGN